MAWGAGGAVDDEAYFDRSPAEVWPCLLGAIREHPSLKVQNELDSSMRIDFNSGWSAWTSGQRMSASVFPQGSGCIVRVGGAGKVSSQIGTASRLKKLNSDVLVAVSRAVQSLPAADRTQPTEAGMTDVASQLAQLAELRGSGALTEEEYAAGKKRILGG